MGEKSKHIVEAPVLLIVFNRPESTKKVLDAIKKAAPKKLYIAADAPRKGNINDEKDCILVKQMINQIDWDCEKHYRYTDTNQGCGAGPFNAISWAFENEDRLIILEDDCVPALPFFAYCNEILERYRHDTRIWVISGNQYNEEAVNTIHSYFLSRYAITSGWATWKRCWSEMDLTLSKYPLILNQDLLQASFRTKKEQEFFQRKIEKVFNDPELKSHIWDFQWAFTVFSNGGLCILPKKNLVKNIGYIGTHTKVKNEFHDRNIDEHFSITSHPDFILNDVNYDEYQFSHHWNKEVSIIKRLLDNIVRIFR